MIHSEEDEKLALKLPSNHSTPLKSFDTKHLICVYESLWLDLHSY